MSSFYLFPLELRRHSERTLHDSVSSLAEENMHDNKCKIIIRQENII